VRNAVLNNEVQRFEKLLAKAKAEAEEIYDKEEYKILQRMKKRIDIYEGQIER